MRYGMLVLALVGTLSVFPVAAQGWFDFVERDELFSVNLPHVPAVEDIVYHSEWGADLPGKVFTAADEQVQYLITVVDCSVSDLPNNSPTWDFYGSVDYAAWNIRKRGGEITYDAWTQFDRIAGHQLQITNDDQSRTYVQILSHADRLYVLEAHAAPEATLRSIFSNLLELSTKTAILFAMTAICARASTLGRAHRRK